MRGIPLERAVSSINAVASERAKMLTACFLLIHATVALCASPFKAGRQDSIFFPSDPLPYDPFQLRVPNSSTPAEETEAQEVPACFAQGDQCLPGGDIEPFSDEYFLLLDGPSPLLRPEGVMTTTAPAMAMAIAPAAAPTTTTITAPAATTTIPAMTTTTTTTTMTHPLEAKTKKRKRAGAGKKQVPAPRTRSGGSSSSSKKKKKPLKERKERPPSKPVSKKPKSKASAFSSWSQIVTNKGPSVHEFFELLKEDHKLSKYDSENIEDMLLMVECIINRIAKGHAGNMEWMNGASVDEAIRVLYFLLHPSKGEVGLEPCPEGHMQRRHILRALNSPTLGLFDHSDYALDSKSFFAMIVSLLGYGRYISTEFDSSKRFLIGACYVVMDVLDKEAKDRLTQVPQLGYNVLIKHLHQACMPSQSSSSTKYSRRVQRNSILNAVRARVRYLKNARRVAYTFGRVKKTLAEIV